MLNTKVIAVLLVLIIIYFLYNKKENISNSYFSKGQPCNPKNYRLCQANLTCEATSGNKKYRSNLSSGWPTALLNGICVSV